MARPKKADADKRTESVRASLTEEEKSHVRCQADRAGITEAEYVRRRILGFEVTTPDSRRPYDPALVSEINRVGINVNQLARATHLGRTFTSYWQEIGGELEKVLARVIRGHGA